MPWVLLRFGNDGNEGKDEDTFAKIPILVKGLVLLDNLILGGYCSIVSSLSMNRDSERIPRRLRRG